MLAKLVTVFSVFLSLVHRVQTQTSTISVGPLLGCDLTTFSCPGVGGCCTIGGCCGSGCCANGYTCINEGTSEEACCPASDPTKCGTVASPSSSGSGSGSGGHTCTGVSNCRDSTGSTWTCLLGQTCGLSYRDCNPCPYIGGGSSPSSTSSSSSILPSSVSSSISSLSISPSTSLSGSFSSSSPSASASSTPSSGGCSREVRSTLHWLAAVAVACMCLL
ncbi:hypothetical protein F4824DRAFT_48120 [Ustulina deusta]|nr:hypothetical protein F4824DRAFT_48120 [Ustulina deusta]